MQRHPQPRNALLIAAGVMTAAASLLHVCIIIGGPSWYRFFGAGERMAQQAARGFIFPTVVTAGIAAALACCALYAFSGAGALRRLPLLDIALRMIAAVFLARGLLGVPAILLIDSAYTHELRAKMTFMVVTSLVCIVIGLGYAAGAAKGRRPLLHSSAPPAR